MDFVTKWFGKSKDEEQYQALVQNFGPKEQTELNKYLSMATYQCQGVSCLFATNKDINAYPNCLIIFRNKKDAVDFMGQRFIQLNPIQCNDEVLWNVHATVRRSFINTIEQHIEGMLPKYNVTYKSRHGPNGAILSGLLYELNKFEKDVKKLGAIPKTSEVFANCSAWIVRAVATDLSETIPVIKNTDGQIQVVADDLTKMLRIEATIKQYIQSRSKFDNKYVGEILNLSHSIGDINVSIRCDNIIEQNVDVLVNSSNPQLRHDGGLALAIVKAGGPGIQQDSDDFISRNGHLPPGGVCYTSAGNMKQDHVIHVVGHQWDKNDETNSTKLLHDSLMNTLNCASSIGARSLAIPIIGTGTYRFPIDVCAKVYRTTLEEFSNTTGNSTTLKDVRIVNNSVGTLRDFIRVYKIDITSAALHSGHAPPDTTNRISNEANTKSGGSELGAFDDGWVDLLRETQDVQQGSHDQRILLSTRGTRPYNDEGYDFKSSPNVSNTRSQYTKSQRTTLPVNASLDSTPHTTYTRSPGVSSVSNTGNASYTTNTHTIAPTPNSSPEASVVSPVEQIMITSNTKIEASTLAPTATTESIATPSHSGDCPICVDDDVPLKAMTCCQNTICNICFDRHFAIDAKCPFCTLVVLMKKGTQPRGTMNTKVDKIRSLPGYEGDGTIVINYHFPSGIQEGHHPNPGKQYSGTSRTAFLPANNDGFEVLELLQRGFEQKILFTIGKSVTTGQDNCVIWNDVHHKTNTHGGPQGYGYPDPTYLSRVKEELAAKGIK